jgi:hypothetical protein
LEVSTVFLLVSDPSSCLSGILFLSLAILAMRLMMPGTILGEVAV